MDHITHLTLEGIRGSDRRSPALSTATAYRLLTACTQLVSFTLPLVSAEPVAYPEPLLLRSLASLIILDYSFHFKALENLVDQLVMPRLRQFHLKNSYHISAIDTSTLVVLGRLAARSPLLSDLSLKLVDFTEPYLATTLQLFPHLTKLNLVCFYRVGDLRTSSGSNATQLLGTLSPTSNLCPALADLTVESDWLPDETWLNFLRMHVDCRSSLRRFDLHFYQCSIPEILPDIGAFRSSGLDVSVRYTPLDDIWGPSPTPWDGMPGEFRLVKFFLRTDANCPV
ncbi:hypothetical protein B0H19DRAFT_1273924 [Mycena capillaripes]|nr:hypothetical protein B0H19DRAFT_1273924 [Mycena capillaripes]